jgi:hypothetical protein
MEQQSFQSSLPTNSAIAAADSAAIGTSNTFGANVISNVHTSAKKVTIRPSPSDSQGSQPQRN